jgi:hypothetical protein
MWLLKPTGFNRGIGIHLFQTFEQLCTILSDHYGIGRGSKDKVSIDKVSIFNKHSSTKSTIDLDKLRSFSFVIQKLIERPLLFQGRKFDIRLFVLVNA